VNVINCLVYYWFRVFISR